MKTKPNIYLAWGFVTMSLFTFEALACPKINGLVDFNCDGRHVVTITGDSFVRGIGEDDPERGGYVGRLSPKFEGSTVQALGVPGVTSQGLLRAFKVNLQKEIEGPTQKRSKDVDLFIIDVGRNDYWNRQAPSRTVTNIKRLVKFLTTELSKDGATPPLISVSTLLHTERDFQSPFIEEVNQLLLKLKSTSLPVGIRFDQVEISGLLTEDGLHPSSTGYEELSQFSAKYIQGKAQRRSKSFRPDRDRDGLYDLFEVIKYQTDPALKDTDGDTVSDGDEILRGTDPLNSNE